MQSFRENWHRVIAHAAGILPLIVLATSYSQDDPLANRTLMLRAGSLGLIFLVASFACTPVSNILGWHRAIQIRRALGLYSVLYMTVHLFVYAVLDNALELDLIVRDIGERRSMLVGMAAFLLLLPLAATSTRGWQRRLGKRWRMLHRLVYLAVPLSVLHFLWLDRDFIDIPLRFAIVVALLLALRFPPLRRAIVRWRQRLQSRRGSPLHPAERG